MTGPSTAQEGPTEADTARVQPKYNKQGDIGCALAHRNSMDALASGATLRSTPTVESTQGARTIHATRR